MLKLIEIWYPIVQVFINRKTICVYCVNYVIATENSEALIKT